MATGLAADTQTVEHSAANAIDRSLLALLARELATPSLRFSEPPKRVLGGFDTTIYSFRLDGAPAAFSRPLIIRIFRGGSGAWRATAESAVQNAVAEAGYPAPRVLLAHPEPSELGGPFTIMERMPGRPMLDGLLGPGILALPAVLGRAHARLHSLDATRFQRLLGAAADRLDLPGPNEALYEAALAMPEPPLVGFAAVARWMDAHRPPPPIAEVICHGDFHPLNVLTERGVVTGVVDWAWVSIGDPAFDVGSTIALVTQGPVDVPTFMKPVARLLRAWVARRYLAGYVAERPVDPDAVRYYEAWRLLGSLLEAADFRRSPRERPGPFDEPSVQRGISARLRQITGAAVSLPA
jgi:aminoglycoside phosphotransferase (APT) family kinase protein